MWRFEGKERKKLFLSPEAQQHIDGDEIDVSNGVNSSTGVQIVNEVLAISLGMANDCPGMLPEQKVCTYSAYTIVLFVFRNLSELFTLMMFRPTQPFIPPG